MNVSEKLDKLEAITREQQEYGTNKLKQANVSYDDGTIQGVNEHIPKGDSSLISSIAFYSVPVINDVKTGGTE